MRDPALMQFTLQAIQSFGDGGARMVRHGNGHWSWCAGPQPLNDQAVRDMIEDGWLRRDGDFIEFVRDTWAPFVIPRESEPKETHHG